MPPDELGSIVDNIGLPVSGINRAYSNTGGIGPQDGDISSRSTRSTIRPRGYVKTLRKALPDAFPGSTFSFLPADIISQILNFGAPAPIDVQVAGPDAKGNEAYAHELVRKLAPGPGHRRRPPAAVERLSRARGRRRPHPGGSSWASPSAT